LSQSGDGLSVLCIDDNVQLGEALARRLAMEPDFVAFRQLTDASAVPAALRDSSPSLVLLDIDLPGGADALALLDVIQRDAPQSRVIVFTGHPGAALALQAMTRGAWGFISKGARSDQLIAALRRVLSGEAVIELSE
jgi:two-component system, NarL family, response regulator FusR